MAIGRGLKEVFKLGGLSVKELSRRVYNEIQQDNWSIYAAALAYYFLFALFPFFLFLAALLAYLPIPHLLEQILTLLESVMPGEALTLVRDNVIALVSRPRSGLLSFGILVALWTASNAMAAITDALNHAYKVDEGRPYWKARLVAIVLTTGLSVFLILSI